MGEMGLGHFFDVLVVRPLDLMQFSDPTVDCFIDSILELDVVFGKSNGSTECFVQPAKQEHVVFEMLSHTLAILSPAEHSVSVAAGLGTGEHGFGGCLAGT